MQFPRVFQTQNNYVYTFSFVLYWNFRENFCTFYNFLNCVKHLVKDLSKHLFELCRLNGASDRERERE